MQQAHIATLFVNVQVETRSVATSVKVERHYLILD